MKQSSSTSLLIIDQSCLANIQPDQELLTQVIGQDLLAQKEVVLITSQDSSIKIAQIRSLISNAAYTTQSAQTKRLFIIWQAEKMTLASQHSLLKILEEPPLDNQIILVVSGENSLLETILSRCLVINHASSVAGVSEDTIVFDQILSGQVSYSDLIDAAEKYQEKNQALTLIDDFSRYLHQQPNYPAPKIVSALQKIPQFKTLLMANINSKLVLELMFFELKRL